MPMEGYFRFTETLRGGTLGACPREPYKKSEQIFEKIAASRNFFVEPTANQGEHGMNREFQQYRFARIEAQNITRARLEAQFKDGIGGLEEIEKAIEQLIMAEPVCTPWRTSDTSSFS